MYMGGATGVQAVELFSSTDFDEIIIFELGKDQKIQDSRFIIFK
jgi:hypothetical protein